MAYRSNPFLERMSERTSDQEFVRLFSPKILERIEKDTFNRGVHVFRSPPGGGKTTLLRAFTPTALQAFWSARHVSEISECYHRLVTQEILDQQTGPLMLGVLISCASGYADLPQGLNVTADGLFRALFDCRVVLRSLRSLATLLRFSSLAQLQDVCLVYRGDGNDLTFVPTHQTASELLQWAEQRERGVYAALDSMSGGRELEIPPHVRFESVLWLQSVHFMLNGKEVAPRRMLMIDDLHKLRRKQRLQLMTELTEIRPSIPIWLAERSIALGVELLSQGTREGRDLREYNLGNIWRDGRGPHQFATFAQNVLDRRLDTQNDIPPGVFSQYMRSTLQPEDLQDLISRKKLEFFRNEVARYKRNPRYVKWVSRAETSLANPNIESLRTLFTTRILLARDELKRQLTLDFEPLSVSELNERESSQVQAAASIFLHEELRVPYYFGIERLCILATSNLEELLSMAAVLYDGLRAKQILRRTELLLSPREQEQLLKKVAKRKLDFIPKNHTEGTRARRLLDAIGSYCSERTFLPNAPYAPGVTGVRLSLARSCELNSGRYKDTGEKLKRVLAECVAENLLVSRESSATSHRDGGTVYYLNRTLCVLYGLPLQMGGWQDIDVRMMINWMERGRARNNRGLLEAR